MTAQLVRYTSPLAACRGAIGFAADRGAIIGGRLVVGETVAPSYYVTRDNEIIAKRSSWVDGLIALAFAMGGEVLDIPPDPAGVERSVAGVVYRLTVS